ncbi:MAG TPA: DUF3164 family protein [Bacteroidales bacterium]|nr:DUF3164 family protein [Bacteroidales bacterium]
MTNNIDYSKVSVADLEAALQQKRDQERRDREARKQDYEADRHELVVTLCKRAEDLSAQLRDFKSIAMRQIEEFRKRAEEYGDIRTNSKGGFSIRNANASYKVAYERNVVSEYDERADLAEQLLREFLGDMVKKRDAQAYEVITGLLERGKSGDFNPAAVAALLKMEDKYTDERWTKAMGLFKESFTTRLISMNVSFFHKDAMDKDVIIPLTFASISPDVEPNTNDHERV